MRTRELLKILLFCLSMMLVACGGGSAGGSGDGGGDSPPPGNNPGGNEPGGSDPGGNDPSDDPGPVTEYVVRGRASGLVAAVALELRLGNSTELLAVVRNGEFAFETQLENGVSYAVVLADSNTPCTLRNQSGLINGADPRIELTCTGASLENLHVSGIAQEVTPVLGVTEYELNLPLSQPSVTISAAAANDGDTVTINGTSVTSGNPSPAIPLNLGENVVDIIVENDMGWRRDYRLTLHRAARLAQYAYGKASNTDADDQFGWSIAVSGDTLAVGARFEDSGATGVDGDKTNNSSTDSGAVYVFRRSGTIWRQEAYLKASNTDPGDDFGFSVALSGDALAVGAPLEDSDAIGINGNQTSDAAGNSGAVYVFRRTETIWQQEAYIKASNTERNDRFGGSVALSGDALAVGAHFEDSAAMGVGGDQADNSASSSGAVYVFRNSTSGWQQEAYIKASNTELGDTFGASVTLSGDTLAVGAPFEDSVATGVDGNDGDNSAASSGAVYVFRRTGTTWQQEAYLKAASSDSDDRFGTSISLSGDVLAVGVPFEDSASTGVDSSPFNNASPDSGAVYVFRRSGPVWQPEIYIKPVTHNAGDQFGSSVALLGDTLAVGAPFEDSAARGVGGDQTDNSAPDSGAVYLFGHVGATWQQSDFLKPSNTDTGDLFGSSVALSGDTIAVGAYFEDSAATGARGDQANNDAADSGAIYIYH